MGTDHCAAHRTWETLNSSYLIRRLLKEEILKNYDSEGLGGKNIVLEHSSSSTTNCSSKKRKKQTKTGGLDNVGVGMVSLALDRSAPPNLVPMDDADGKGGAKSCHWTRALLKQFPRPT